MISRGIIKSLLSAAVLALVLAAPVWLAFRVADQQSMQSGKTRAMDFANEVLHRSEVTADQIDAAFKRLTANGGSTPCSSSNQVLMYELDLTSSSLQAVGYMRDNKLVCSSLGLSNAPVPLGLSSWDAPDKVHFRNHVIFPFAPTVQFAVIEREGYVAIIHLRLPIDVGDTVPGLALAALSIPANQVIAQRGSISQQWILQLHGRQSIQFVDDDHVIAVVASQRHALVAVAALPLTEVQHQEQLMLEYLIPAAVLVGILLIVGLLHLSRQQQGMPSMIRAALRNNEFQLHYQPIVDAGTRRWIGAEALIRWVRPSGENIRPDLFIMVAEETGLITEITERVIDLLRKDAKGLFVAHPDFCISINLSAADLRRTRTTILLRHLVNATGATARNFSAEITERSFVNTEETKKIVDDMRASGFRVSLDDFGTGYSSLASLASFDLDYIKIDKSFVDAVGTDAPTHNVVRHIVELARALNLDLIAEGVETELQVAQLQQLGVNRMQGWLFSKAITMKELRAKLSSAGNKKTAH